MWIFTRGGFVSVVRDADGSKHALLVRARTRGCLESFLAPYVCDVEHTPDADYAYCARVNSVQVGAMARRAVGEIDYSNFEGGVLDEAYHGVLARVLDETRALKESPAENSEQPGSREGQDAL